jgi:uncharacterized protein (DUF779 family)
MSRFIVKRLAQLAVLSAGLLSMRTTYAGIPGGCAGTCCNSTAPTCCPNNYICCTDTDVPYCCAVQ